MLIHKLFRKGVDTIEMEYPWITPASIEYLESKLTKDLDVLEFGAGGSTFFFSRRCRSVTSIETNPEWYAKVMKFVENRNIKNVKVHLVKDRYESINILGGRKFDVIMVDCDPGSMNRAGILRQVRGVNTKDRCMVIVDNYTNKYCGKTDIIMNGYSFVDFNDPPWDGTGTRVLTKNW